MTSQVSDVTDLTVLEKEVLGIEEERLSAPPLTGDDIETSFDNQLWDADEAEAVLQPAFERWDEGRMLVGPGRAWQPHSIGEYPQLKPLFKVVERILEQSFYRRTKRRQRPDLRYLLKRTIINFYLAGMADQGVSYYRSGDGYSAGTREHSLHLTHHRILRVMDALRDSGLTSELRAGKRGKWCTTDVLTPIGATIFYSKVLPASIGRVKRAMTDVIQLRSQRRPDTRRRHYGLPGFKGVRQMRRQIEAVNQHNARYPTYLPLRLSELAALSHERLKQLAQNIMGFVPELYRHQSEQASKKCRMGRFLIDSSPSLVSSSMPFSVLRTDPERRHRLEELPWYVEWLRGQSGNDAEICVPIDLSVYRVFVIRAEEDQRYPDRWLCGRFVGEYQLLPEKWRERLVYKDGEEVHLLHERDVVAMFINLAYNLTGMPMPDDPYQLTGEFSPEKLEALGITPKQLVKYPALIWLGANTKHEGSLAIRGYLEENRLQVNVERVRKAIKRKHQAIARRFGCGYGLELMRRESDIAFGVMCGHLEAGRPGPILAVHDSYLSSDPTSLDDLVRECYRDVVGDAYECQLH
jgi:hypothetical protein